MNSKQKSVHVRMYNVGFGDCFLLTFPADDRPRRVLIDCGSIAKASMDMKDVVGALIEEVTDADGVANIDVIVCTHRHADHVSGFADPRWADVKVGEVWFPWTEDPKDSDAKRIRETQSKLALALKDAWTAKVAAADTQHNRDYLDIALNALSNQNAMTMLHSGISSRPVRKFLGVPAQGMEAMSSQLLPGVSCYVLGPSRSEKVIRDMEPPSGKTYLMQMAGNGEADEVFEPFGAEWGVLESQFTASHLMISPFEKTEIQTMADLADTGVAVSLDKAVNGTSLVLVFEIGKAVLFFPGDAQWGTWNEILRDEEARELVERASFFKVGHHGSHNATPIEYVEDVMRNNCCAMLSTRIGKWASIPKAPLVQELEQRGILARSDEPRQLASPFVRSDTKVTDAEIPI